MVNELNRVYDLIITCIFLWTLSTVCCNLILLQTQLVDNTNPLDGLRTIFLAIWSFVVNILKNKHFILYIVLFFVINSSLFQTIYVVCILGQRMTDQFNDFNVELDQCNWYTFPTRLQKMYGIFVHNAQQEMGLRGYGNLLCSLDTMKRVIRA